MEQSLLNIVFLELSCAEALEREGIRHQASCPAIDNVFGTQARFNMRATCVWQVCSNGSSVKFSKHLIA